MAARKETILVLLANTLLLAWCQDFRSCARQVECGDCINLGQGGCAWCAEEGFIPARCQPVANLTATQCSPNSILNPRSLTDERILSTGEIHSIDISRIQLSLRVGDPQTFTVTVTPQRNLPLDLYILIDFSGSMRDELRTIQNSATRIAARIAGITDDVRLGFGSFNDKRIQPFTHTPLSVGDPPFFNPAPFTFRHVVSLTNDTDFFSTRINSISTTNNVDTPENGLEALAQVISCEDIIGWRPETKDVGSRVVLFMSDQQSHFAGEGRLAGILTPYVGECLLNTNGSFTAFDQYDFPSVGKILELLAQNSITVLFAIESTQVMSYETLVDTIFNANSKRAITEDFHITDSGAADQEEILELIEDGYRRILQSVSLDFSDMLVNVSIQVTATCPNSSDSSSRVESCLNVPVESEVHFEVRVVLNSCDGVQDMDMIDYVISSPSFGTFNLSLRMICDCQCDEFQSPCNNNGVPHCGVCECDSGYCGDECQIRIGSTNVVSPTLTITSRDCPVGGNGLRCSGKGSCVCNCICDQPDDFPDRMIFGDACQCDTYSCLMPGDQEICTGRGMCCDGRCICNDSPSGYPYRGNNVTGIESCQCEPEEEVCRDPENPDTLCNGRGTCGCHFCNCELDRDYTGTFCDALDIGTCGHRDDEACINQCRRVSTPEPDICPDMCAKRRPVLFVNTNMTAQRDLLNVTNGRLNATGSIFPGQEFVLQSECDYIVNDCATMYYILHNATHYALVVIREQLCVGGSQLSIAPGSLVPIILVVLLIPGILAIILIKVVIVTMDYLEAKKDDSDSSKDINPLYEIAEKEKPYGRD